MGNSGHGDGRERESPPTPGISPDITCVAWYALTFRCLHVPFVLQPKDHGYISSWNTSLFLSIASFSLCLGTFTCHSHPPTNPRRPPPNSFIPYIPIPPIGHTTPPPGPGGGGGGDVTGQAKSQMSHGLPFYPLAPILSRLLTHSGWNPHRGAKSTGCLKLQLV